MSQKSNELFTYADFRLFVYQVRKNIPHPNLAHFMFNWYLLWKIYKAQLFLSARPFPSTRKEFVSLLYLAGCFSFNNLILRNKSKKDLF